MKHKYDLHDMYGSIHGIPQQISHALTDKQFDQLRSIDSSINNIIIVGMGSSLIAFKLLQSLYENKICVPTAIVNNERLPIWADQHALVILSSYSGNSIETLSCAAAAIKQKCNIVGITTGGKLFDLIKNNSHFIYRMVPNLYNPCKQARMAVGFSFGSYIKILQKLRLIYITEKDIATMVKLIQKLDIKTIERKAKKYSKKMANKYLQIISGGYLSGNAELLTKQLNWNAKQYAALSLVPEAMHHICESILHPRGKKDTLFVLLSSSFLGNTDSQDLAIIKEYLIKMRTSVLEIKVSGASFKGVTTTLILTSFMSFHLAIAYDQNPTPTPAIDFYKRHYENS